MRLLGSIVATLFAEGYSTNDIFKIFKNYSQKINYFEYKNIFKLISGIILERKIRITGLSTGRKIENYVQEFSIKISVTLNILYLLAVLIYQMEIHIFLLLKI